MQLGMTDAQRFFLQSYQHISSAMREIVQRVVNGGKVPRGVNHHIGGHISKRSGRKCSHTGMQLAEPEPLFIDVRNRHFSSRDLCKCRKPKPDRPRAHDQHTFPRLYARPAHAMRTNGQRLHQGQLIMINPSFFTSEADGTERYSTMPPSTCTPQTFICTQQVVYLLQALHWPQ